MNKSEQINELSAALAKAQGAMTSAKRDSENPYFNSRYADLASVWDAIRKPLSDNGLAVVQAPGIGENGLVTVETTLTHLSGQWCSSTISVVPVKSDPQSLGSVITYLRRYSLSAITGIAPDDDDAEGAMGRKEEPASRKRQPKPGQAEAAPPSFPDKGKTFDSLAIFDEKVESCTKATMLTKIRTAVESIPDSERREAILAKIKQRMYDLVYLAIRNAKDDGQLNAIMEFARTDPAFGPAEQALLVEAGLQNEQERNTK